MKEEAVGIHDLMKKRVSFVSIERPGRPRLHWYRRQPQFINTPCCWVELPSNSCTADANDQWVLHLRVPMINIDLHLETKCQSSKEILLKKAAWRAALIEQHHHSAFGILYQHQQHVTSLSSLQLFTNRSSSCCWTKKRPMNVNEREWSLCNFGDTQTECRGWYDSL